MPRFAANLTFLFNEVPFLDRFAEAARAGFRAVEFAFGYDFAAADLAARAAAHALEVVLINAPPGDFAGGERGLASLPGREDDFAASIATALRYAQALKCPRLHVMAGVVPEGADAAEQARRWATFRRNLALACREAAKVGVTVMIEPINRRDFPGYLLTRQAEAHAIREELGLPNLSVQMDFYHAQIVEGDLATRFRQWQAHIGHVQIAGVPGRHEPDVGEINYAYLFHLLDELGYDGWVGCEYKPVADTIAGLAWLRELVDRSPETGRLPFY
ncbi:MAG: hydroxypyruvate isomerase family protein [Burkholderiales bacterium]|nr:hydroxypyruvate isomerase family protein [Burkholderiales bacterium]